MLTNNKKKNQKHDLLNNSQYEVVIYMAENNHTWNINQEALLQRDLIVKHYELDIPAENINFSRVSIFRNGQELDPQETRQFWESIEAFSLFKPYAEKVFSSASVPEEVTFRRILAIEGYNAAKSYNPLQESFAATKTNSNSTVPIFDIKRSSLVENVRTACDEFSYGTEIISIAHQYWEREPTLALELLPWYGGNKPLDAILLDNTRYGQAVIRSKYLNGISYANTGLNFIVGSYERHATRKEKNIFFQPTLQSAATDIVFSAAETTANYSASVLLHYGYRSVLTNIILPSMQVITRIAPFALTTSPPGWAIEGAALAGALITDYYFWEPVWEYIEPRSKSILSTFFKLQSQSSPRKPMQLANVSLTFSHTPAQQTQKNLTFLDSELNLHASQYPIITRYDQNNVRPLQITTATSPNGSSNNFLSLITPQQPITWPYSSWTHWTQYFSIIDPIRNLPNTDFMPVFDCRNSSNLVYRDPLILLSTPSNRFLNTFMFDHTDIDYTLSAFKEVESNNDCTTLYSEASAQYSKLVTLGLENSCNQNASWDSNEINIVMDFNLLRAGKTPNQNDLSISYHTHSGFVSDNNSDDPQVGISLFQVTSAGIFFSPVLYASVAIEITAMGLLTAGLAVIPITLAGIGIKKLIDHYRWKALPTVEREESTLSSTLDKLKKAEEKSFCWDNYNVTHLFSHWTNIKEERKKEVAKTLDTLIEIHKNDDSSIITYHALKYALETDNLDIVTDWPNTIEKGINHFIDFIDGLAKKAEEQLRTQEFQAARETALTIHQWLPNNFFSCLTTALSYEQENIQQSIIVLSEGTSLAKNPAEQEALADTLYHFLWLQALQQPELADRLREHAKQNVFHYSQDQNKRNAYFNTLLFDFTTKTILSPEGIITALVESDITMGDEQRRIKGVAHIQLITRLNEQSPYPLEASSSQKEIEQQIKFHAQEAQKEFTAIQTKTSTDNVHLATALMVDPTSDKAIQTAIKAHLQTAFDCLYRKAEQYKNKPSTAEETQKNETLTPEELDLVIFSGRNLVARELVDHNYQMGIELIEKMMAFSGLEALKLQQLENDMIFTYYGYAKFLHQQAEDAKKAADIKLAYGMNTEAIVYAQECLKIGLSVLNKDENNLQVKLCCGYAYLILDNNDSQQKAKELFFSIKNNYDNKLLSNATTLVSDEEKNIAALAHVALSDLALNDKQVKAEIALKNAIKLREQALVIEPELPAVQYCLGELLENAGEHEEALDRYIMCMAVSTDEDNFNLKANVSCARILCKQHRIQEAKEQLQKAKEIVKKEEVTALDVGLDAISHYENARENCLMAEVGTYAFYHLANYMSRNAREDNSSWYSKAALYYACAYEFVADDIFSVLQQQQQTTLMKGLGIATPNVTAWDQLQQMVMTPSFFLSAAHKTMQGVTLIRRMTSWCEQGSWKTCADVAEWGESAYGTYAMRDRYYELCYQDDVFGGTFLNSFEPYIYLSGFTSRCISSYIESRKINREYMFEHPAIYLLNDVAKGVSFGVGIYFFGKIIVKKYGKEVVLSAAKKLVPALAKGALGATVAGVGTAVTVAYVGYLGYQRYQEKSLEAIKWNAQLYTRDHKFEEAIANLEKYLEKRPDDAVAKSELISARLNLLFNSGDYHAVILKSEDFNHNEMDEIFWLRGQAFLKIGKLLLARDEFLKLANDRFGPYANAQLAMITFARGDLYQAKIYCSTAIRNFELELEKTLTQIKIAEEKKWNLGGLSSKAHNFIKQHRDFFNFFGINDSWFKNHVLHEEGLKKQEQLLNEIEQEKKYLTAIEKETVATWTKFCGEFAGTLTTLMLQCIYHCLVSLNQNRVQYNLLPETETIHITHPARQPARVASCERYQQEQSKTSAARFISQQQGFTAKRSPMQLTSSAQNYMQQQGTFAVKRQNATLMPKKTVNSTPRKLTL